MNKKAFRIRLLLSFLRSGELRWQGEQWQNIEVNWILVLHLIDKQLIKIFLQMEVKNEHRD